MNKALWIVAIIVVYILSGFQSTIAADNKEQVKTDSCINLPIDEFIKTNPDGKPCKVLRLALFKRCILNGGKDEYTQNCAEHTFPTDHVGALKIELTSRIRKQLYWHCAPNGNNIACCDHITVKDQCEINTCGRKTGSKHCEAVGVGVYTPPRLPSQKLCVGAGGKLGYC